MNLIQLGDVTLNSGLKSDFKLVCDDFIKDNLGGLVTLIKRVCGPFSHVKGIPRGGLLLEEALVPHVSHSLTSTLLIVDDVLTTGGSFRRFREKLSESYTYIIGVAVFARGECPVWVAPLFQLHWKTFLKEKK